MYDGTIFQRLLPAKAIEKTQGALNAHVAELADAVTVLADAVENGSLQDKHHAAQEVEGIARVIALITKT